MASATRTARPASILKAPLTVPATHHHLHRTQLSAATTARVHFPPTPNLSNVYLTHSDDVYDRSAIVVLPNPCELPPRGSRKYTVETHPMVDPYTHGRGLNLGDPRAHSLDVAPISIPRGPSAISGSTPRPKPPPRPRTPYPSDVPALYPAPPLVADLTSDSDESSDAAPFSNMSMSPHPLMHGHGHGALSKPGVEPVSSLYIRVPDQAPPYAPGQGMRHAAESRLHTQLQHAQYQQQQQMSQVPHKTHAPSDPQYTQHTDPQSHHHSHSHSRSRSRSRSGKAPTSTSPFKTLNGASFSSDVPCLNGF